MGLSAVYVKSPAWSDRLLLVSALAQVPLTLLGAAGESLGVATPPFPQGCLYYQASQ